MYCSKCGSLIDAPSGICKNCSELSNNKTNQETEVLEELTLTEDVLPKADTPLPQTSPNKKLPKSKIAAITIVTILIILFGIFLALYIPVYTEDKKAVENVELLIDEIGEVVFDNATLDRIEKASEAYELLTDKQKEKVDNSYIINDAINQYDLLLYKERINILVHQIDLNVTALDSYVAAEKYPSMKPVFRNVAFDTHINTILDTYDKLSTPPPSAKDIEKAFNEVYDTYNALYDEVMGPIPSSSAIDTANKNYKTAFSNLEKLMPEISQPLSKRF